MIEYSVYVLVALIGFLFGLLFANSAFQKRIKMLSSQRDWWMERHRSVLGRLIDTFDSKVELLMQHSEIVHKIDELQKYVTYNNTIFQPHITDWYSVVRRSGTYKTLFRDRALFDVGTGKWGGPETDPVIYWLPNIPLPED